METREQDGSWSLTEKEKQTLRLMVRGHDAKSIARTLDLSVHTINERLRDARRKMAVSSSRAAARLLLEVEGERAPGTPDISGDEGIGADLPRNGTDGRAAPIGGARRAMRLASLITGIVTMTIFIALLTLGSAPPAPSIPAQPPVTAAPASETPAALSARHWLALVDEGRWEDSYRATAASFRELNTVERWSAASEKARVPLGRVVSRTFVGEDDVPAPPHGYTVVKFRTRFANKDAETVETVSLDREQGQWRVVGVYIG